MEKITIILSTQCGERKVSIEKDQITKDDIEYVLRSLRREERNGGRKLQEVKEFLESNTHEQRVEIWNNRRVYAEQLETSTKTIERAFSKYPEAKKRVK